MRGESRIPARANRRGAPTHAHNQPIRTTPRSTAATARDSTRPALPPLRPPAAALRPQPPTPVRVGVARLLRVLARRLQVAVALLRRQLLPAPVELQRDRDSAPRQPRRLRVAGSAAARLS